MSFSTLSIFKRLINLLDSYTKCATMKFVWLINPETTIIYRTNPGLGCSQTTHIKLILTRTLSRLTQSCKTWWISCMNSSARTKFHSMKWPAPSQTSRKVRRILTSKIIIHCLMVLLVQAIATQCWALRSKIKFSCPIAANSHSKSLRIQVVWTSRRTWVTREEMEISLEENMSILSLRHNLWTINLL